MDDIRDYFSGNKCNVKLKQKHPLLGFHKPGGFYSILVESISDNAVTVQDVNGGKHTVKMSDVLFIKEFEQTHILRMENIALTIRYNISTG